VMLPTNTRKYVISLLKAKTDPPQWARSESCLRTTRPKNIATKMNANITAKAISPAQIGAQIARSVYGGIGNRR